MKMHVSSFPPIASEQSKVLILGTVPGRRSLELNEYYANPQNIFWTLMGELCEAGPSLTYVRRVTRLKEVGIAVWDVLKHCEREGSRDTGIVDRTAVPNDLEGFLRLRPTIRAIFFNGGKAETAFLHWVVPVSSQELLSSLSLTVLPSTSPANTRISRQEKRAQWEVIRRFL